MPSETFAGNLQPQPSFNTGVTFNLIFPVLKSERFRVPHGHQGDLPLGGQVERWCGVLFLICMLLAEVFLLCYLMGEVREVQLYSERYWLLVSALAPSAILCLGTL